MRRNVCGHAHRNPARPVGQKIGEGCGQNLGFRQGAIVIWAEINGVFVQPFKQRLGHRGHARLSISACRGVIAINISKISLTIDQWIAQVKILGQTRHCVINRGIAMWVVIPHHIARDFRRFTEAPVRGQTQLAHCKQDAAMNGFQAITRIRQGAMHDGGQRILQIARANGTAERLNFPLLVKTVIRLAHCTT